MPAGGSDELKDEIESQINSTGPKVAAAADFARSGRGKAVIGSLDDITALVEHRAGTLITAHCSGVTFREGTPPARNDRVDGRP